MNDEEPSRTRADAASRKRIEDGHASARDDASPVSITSGADGHTIVYRWSLGHRWGLTLIVWLMVEAALFVNYAGAVGWDNFNLIDYPAFAIVSFFIAYLAAISIFNRTTTTITDTTFSVRRGPVPCLWPGNHVRAIDDVRQITYACYNTVVVNGNRLCSVYVTFKDGKQANLFTIGNDEGRAVGLATQLKDWIEEKRRGQRRAESSSDDETRVSASAWFPPDRTQRLKIMASVFIILCAMAALVAIAEHFAAEYRPVHQARRHDQQYEALVNQLRAPENYAAAVPMRWRTYAHPGEGLAHVTYGGRERSFYPRLSEVFESPGGGVRLSVKRSEAEYVSGTPCGRADYFVFPLPKSALRNEPSGTVSAQTSMFKTSSFRSRIMQDANGVEWLCFGESPGLP